MRPHLFLLLLLVHPVVPDLGGSLAVVLVAAQLRVVVGRQGVRLVMVGGGSHPAGAEALDTALLTWKTTSS